MVRPHAESFGFDEMDRVFAKYENNVEKSKLILEKNAKKMKKDAVSIATSKGLKVTGEGVKGITTESTNNGYNVGWSSRPNLHLYFHERGFHAQNNRQKQTVFRDSKGARTRHYKPGQATYVPPSPHMRPAFERNKMAFLNEMRNTIQDTT